MTFHTSKITAATKRIALVSEQPLPEWGMSPSPFDWQVLIYGGTHDGFPLPAMTFQFFKRRPNGAAGYTLAGVIDRADEMAGWNKRTRFMVRDTDGRVVADSAVCWPRERAAA